VDGNIIWLLPGYYASWLDPWLNIFLFVIRARKRAITSSEELQFCQGLPGVCEYCVKS